jgi:hypothetical protein
MDRQAALRKTSADKEFIMRTTSTFCVLALAGATVIGLSLTTQQAQAFSFDHVTGTVHAAVMAKPPGGGGNKGGGSNKGSFSNKNSSSFKYNKSSFNYKNGGKYWYGGNYWYGGYPWFNGYCYNTFGCYNCYSPYSCYGWYNCCPDTNVDVPPVVVPPVVTPIDIEVHYKKTVK